MIRRTIKEPLNDRMSSDITLGDLVDLVHTRLKVGRFEALGVVGGDCACCGELLLGELM